MSGRPSTSSGYEIARTTGLCASTGHPIAPGDTYVATLCERAEEEGLDRLDFCLEAWESGDRPERLFSYWRTVMPDANHKPNALVDNDVLKNLFHRLEDETEPIRIAYRFVLGLILMRKKLLRCERTETRGGETIWMMRERGSDPETPPFEMIDPHLDDERTREVSDQLGEILRGEL